MDTQINEAMTAAKMFKGVGRFADQLNITAQPKGDAVKNVTTLEQIK